MNYLTIEEYNNLGGTKEVSPLLFELSEEKINDLTFNRIVAIGFNNLTEFQKQEIKKCMYILVEYYNDNPDLIDSNGDITNLNSYSVGDISVSVDNTSFSSQIMNTYNIPLRVYKSLKKTGLMRRGFDYY